MEHAEVVRSTQIFGPRRVSRWNRWSRSSKVSTTFERRRFDAVGTLTAYFCFLYLVPQRWVFPGLGAAGHPSNLFAVGILVAWMVTKMMPVYERRRSLIRWPLIANALVLGASYAMAFDRGLTSSESLAADRALLQAVSFAGVVLMVAEGLWNIRQVEVLLSRLTYLSSFIAIVGLIQYVLRFDPYSVVSFPGLVLNADIADLGTRGSEDFVRVQGSMGHAIEFGVAMTMVLPIAIHLALHETRPGWRKVRVGLAGLHFAASLLSVSRSAVLALACVGFALVWVWPNRVRVRAAFGTFVAALVLQVLTPGLLGTIRSLFANWQVDPSISGRTEDYDILSRLIDDRPWLGRGPGTFIPTDYFFVDNAYLIQMVTTGYLGLASLVLFLVSGLLAALAVVVFGQEFRSRHLAAGFLSMTLVTTTTSATFDHFSFATVTGLFALAVGASQVVAAEVPRTDKFSGWRRTVAEST